MALSLSFMNSLFLEITGIWVAYAQECNIEKYRGQGMTSGHFGVGGGGACAPFAHPWIRACNQIWLLHNSKELLQLGDNCIQIWHLGRPIYLPK